MNDILLKALLEFDGGKLANSFSIASKEAVKLEQALKQSLEQLTKNGKNGTEQFKSVQKQLNEATANVNRYDKALKLVTESTTNLETKSKGAFSKFNFADTVSKVTALSSEFQKLSTDILSLDKATSGIRSLGGEAARIAPALEAISLKMAKDLPFSAAEFQSSFQTAILGGVKGGTQGLVEFNETAAKLAVGGMAELQDASKSLSTLLREFGASSSESEKYANTLFSTVKFGLTSIPELNASLSQVVPSAAAAGIAFDNIGAALALMTKNGTPTADATSKLNKLITELQKPGDALAHTMHKAGVSLATLKNDGLPATLERIRASLQETGKASSQAFSSPEAAEAFKTLTKSSGEFSNVLSSIQNDVGATDRAYSSMASSMGVQSKQLTTSFQAFILEGIKPIAPAFTAMSTAFNVAGPILQTGAAIKSLLPTVAAQTAATGAATTAQVGLNAAMLANPVGIVIGSIVALTAVTAILNHTLRDTAQEKKADAVAEGELLAMQKKDIESKISQINNTNLQIKSYESLSKEREKLISNTSRTAEEENRLKEITSQLAGKSDDLAKTYPKAIKGVQDYTGNLSNLRNEAQSTSQQLVELNAESAKITKKIRENSKQQLALEIDVQKSNLEDQLTEVFDRNFLDSFLGIGANMNNVIAKSLNFDFSGAADSALESLIDLGNVVGAGFGEEIGEAVLTTSKARKTGESFIKDFADGIYNSKDSSEVQKQVDDFKNIVYNSQTIDTKDKKKIIQGAEELGQARLAALKAEKAEEAKLYNENAQTIVKTFNTVKNSGGNTDEALKSIASTLGITTQKAKELAIKKELDDASKSGGVTEEVVQKISNRYGESTDKVRELKTEQDKVKDSVIETSSAVDLLAQSFNHAVSESSKVVNTNISALAQTFVDIENAIRGFNFHDALKSSLSAATFIADGRKAVAEGNKLSNSLKQATLLIKGTSTPSKGGKPEEPLSFVKEDEEEKRKQNNLTKQNAINNINDILEQEKARLLETQRIANEAIDKQINDAKDKAAKQRKDKKKVDETSLKEYIQTLEAGKKFTEEDYNEGLLKATANHILSEQKLRDEEDAQKRSRVIAYDQFLLNSLTNNLTMTEQVMQRLLQSGARLQQEEMTKLAENKIKIIEDANKQEQILEQKRREDAINAIVNNSYEVKRAQEEVDKALAKGKDKPAYLNAKKVLEDTKEAQRKSNEEVRAIQEQAAEKQAQDRIDREYKFANIRATAIQDTALRERDLAVAEAKYTYDQEILLANGNRDKEIAAEMRHQQEISKIAQKYIIQSNQQKKLAFDFATSLQQKFRDLQIADNSEAKKALNREEDDLRKSLAKREISYHEYTEKLNEIDQKRSEFSNVFQQLFTVTTQTMVETSKSSLDNYVNKFVESIDLTDSIDEKSTEKKKEALEAQEKAADETYAAMGAFAISSAAAQIAAGKSVAEVAINTLLDTLVAAVPIFVAMNFGKEPITGAFVSAALLGLVAAAKASVASAKFAKGGIAGKYGEQQIIVGEEGPEAIIPAKITRKYKPQILQMIDGKNPATIFGKDGEIHREVYVQTDPHLYKKVDQLTGQVEKLAKSTEQYAMSVRRQTTIDVGGQVKVGLDGKEAIIQLQRATARRAVL